MDCSIVVISRNRPRHLERLFGYFAEEGLDAPIFLGDASDPDATEAVAAVCSRFDGRLDIRRTNYAAGAPPVNRLRREFDKVETGAVIWVGDDDFVSPRILREASDHLARLPACATVTGRAVTFSVAGDGAGGKVNGLGDYPQKKYPQTLASDRLIAQAKDGVALTYSLRRTQVARRLLGEIDDLALSDDALGYYLFELLDGMLTVIAGQVCLCEEVMMARQVHAVSTSAEGRKERDGLALLASPAWPESFASAQGLVAGRLTEMQQGIDAGKAREIASTALWIRVRAMIDKELSRRLGTAKGASVGKRVAAALLRLRSGRYPVARSGELARMLSAVEQFSAGG